MLITREFRSSIKRWNNIEARARASRKKICFQPKIVEIDWFSCRRCTRTPIHQLRSIRINAFVFACNEKKYVSPSRGVTTSQCSLIAWIDNELIKVNFSRSSWKLESHLNVNIFRQSIAIWVNGTIRWKLTFFFFISRIMSLAAQLLTLKARFFVTSLIKSLPKIFKGLEWI